MLFLLPYPEASFSGRGKEEPYTVLHDRKLGTDTDDAKHSAGDEAAIIFVQLRHTPGKGLISRKIIRPTASGRHCRLCAGRLATSNFPEAAGYTAKPRLFRPVRFSRISSVQHHLPRNFGRRITVITRPITYGNSVTKIL